MPEQPAAQADRPQDDDLRHSPRAAPVADTTLPPVPTGTPPQDATNGSSAGDSAAQLAWLHRELGRELATYRRRRKRDKRKAFGLQMATVTLSATITVLLGLRATGTAQQRLADVALALGAVITVLAAAEAFFGHRGLWMLRTETVRHLEALAREVDYHQAGLNSQPPDPAAVQRYRVELDRILASDLTAWQRLRAAPTGGTSISSTTDARTTDSTPVHTPPGG
jgi:hypothetical protein